MNESLNTETRRHGERRGEEEGDDQEDRPSPVSPGQPHGALTSSSPSLFPSSSSSVSPCLRVDSGIPLPPAVLTVRDTGIGIEPELLPHLFEPFTQADRSLDRSRGGLGLGLALVKGLVELHGGEVSVESDGAGRGSEFMIRLPTIPAPATPASDLPRVAPSLGPVRILIVEDNPDAAGTLRDVLELMGGTVQVAHSGPEAVSVAAAFQPEVVLCDLGLPGMDGFQVAAELRRNPATADARLIAVSGYGQEEDQRRSQEAGFERHLTKPIDLDELQWLLAAGAERREG